MADAKIKIIDLPELGFGFEQLIAIEIYKS
jgi:hypothetical protein